MADLPEATLSVDDQAGAFAGGTGYIVVAGCVGTNADGVPRVFSSTKSLLAQHNYAPAVDYAAMHFEESGKPVIFIGLPVATAAMIGSNDDTGVEGTSVISVTGTPLDEVDGILTVTTGGTIGVHGIVFTLSLDGGWTEKTIRLGTATSYVVPYLGITINFAAGDLDAEDVYTFRTIAPLWDAAALTAARRALAAQQRLARTWMVVGEIPDSTFAGYIVTEANAYDTSHDRYVRARANVKDQILGLKSKVTAQTLTFAAAGDTCTRSAGSFVADGLKVGDTVTIAGTADNDGSHIITTLTPTVATFAGSTIVDETIDSEDVDMYAVQTRAAYIAAQDAAFASVSGQRRLDLSIGRARMLSPITSWSFRRPSGWRLSTREYQHDLHIPCWRKADGPLNNCDITDGDGTVIEFDERVDSGALAAGFSCLRTFANGPNGAFGAMSLTRADENSLLSRSHNVDVTNLASTVTHKATESAIGQSLVLKSDGKATEESLAIIEGRVNSALQIALLQDNGEGPRASSAVWRASRNDVLNVVGAPLNGTLTLLLNGTVEKINTVVRIQSAS